MPATGDAILRRLEEIEQRLAFLDDLVESLNAVVARQDREIVELRRQAQDLEQRLRQVGDALAGPAAAGHEVPPHY